MLSQTVGTLAAALVVLALVLAFLEWDHRRWKRDRVLETLQRIGWTAEREARFQAERKRNDWKADPVNALVMAFGEWIENNPRAAKCISWALLGALAFILGGVAVSYVL